MSDDMAQKMSDLPTQRELDTPWTQLDTLITEYVDRYEMADAEDGDGNAGDYSPSDWERCLIMDAIQGLLGDDGILDKIAEAREYTAKLRIEAGECVHCGRKLPDHWGGCSMDNGERT